MSVAAKKKGTANHLTLRPFPNHASSILSAVLRSGLEIDSPFPAQSESVDKIFAANSLSDILPTQGDNE
jgi:hypothetical protein